MGPRGLGQAFQGQGCPLLSPAVSGTSRYLMGKQGRQMGQELDGLFFSWPDISSKRGPLSPPSHPLHLFSQEGLGSQGMSESWETLESAEPAEQGGCPAPSPAGRSKDIVSWWSTLPLDLPSG